MKNSLIFILSFLIVAIGFFALLFGQQGPAIGTIVGALFIGAPAIIMWQKGLAKVWEKVFKGN